MTAPPQPQQRFIATAALLLVVALLSRAAVQGTATAIDIDCPGGNECSGATFACEGPEEAVFTASCTGMEVPLAAPFARPPSPQRHSLCLFATPTNTDKEFGEAAKCVDSALDDCGATALTMRLWLGTAETCMSQHHHRCAHRRALNRNAPSHAMLLHNLTAVVFPIPIFTR